MTLADNKYISLTTFKRDGTPVATPVWIVGLADGKLGFYTSSATWKVKRLAHDPRVEVRPCDMRGRVPEQAPTRTGTAVVVDGDDLDQIKAKVHHKYGAFVTASELAYKVGGLFGRKPPTYDRAIVITLDPDPGDEADPA